MAIFSRIGKFLKEKIIEPITSFFSFSNKKLLVETRNTKSVVSSVDSDISYVVNVFTNEGFRFAEDVASEIDRRNKYILKNASVEQLKSYRKKLEEIGETQQANADDTLKRVASSLDSRFKNTLIPINKIHFDTTLSNVVIKLSQYETKENSPCEIMDNLWHYTTPFKFFKAPNQSETNSLTKADTNEKQLSKTPIIEVIQARIMFGVR